MIRPWEIDELPYTWLDAFTALTDDLPAMKASRAEVNRVIANLQARNKGKRQ